MGQRVEELKSTQITRLSEQAEAFKNHVGQTADHQCHMIDQRAEQEIQILTGQINARREQQKMQVHQALEQQAMAATSAARQQDIMRQAYQSYVPPVGGLPF